MIASFPLQLTKSFGLLFGEFRRTIVFGLFGNGEKVMY